MTKSSAILIVVFQLCTVVGSPAQSPPQAVNSVVPKAPNLLQRRSEKQKNICSIPLLQKGIEPDKDFKIYRVAPPRIDDAFVLKPSAPSCKLPAWCQASRSMGRKMRRLSPILFT